MSNKYLKSIAKSETGYASFVITLITMIIVSLIVVAFAADARLEQKNSLGNTLATQAYYAAESGINDAYAVISSDIQTGAQPESTGSQCASSSNAPAYINGTSNVLVPGSNGVEYTCLIVNTQPSSLQYTDAESEVIPINTTSLIKYITISWAEPNASNLNFSGCPDPNNGGNGEYALTLPSLANYSTTSCDAGVLQLDMVSAAGLESEVDASSNPFNSQATTVYLYPQQEPLGSAGEFTTSTGEYQNEVFPVECSNTEPNSYGQEACTVRIGLIQPSTTYYLHLQSFYEASDVTITAQDSNQKPLDISGSQILVDSTGEADGQLKRIQENVCDNAYCGNSDVSSNAAIQSTQCINKEFPVYPGESSAYDPASQAPC